MCLIWSAFCAAFSASALPPQPRQHGQLSLSVFPLLPPYFLDLSPDPGSVSICCPVSSSANFPPWVMFLGHKLSSVFIWFSFGLIALIHNHTWARVRRTSVPGDEPKRELRLCGLKSVTNKNVGFSVKQPHRGKWNSCSDSWPAWCLVHPLLTCSLHKMKLIHSAPWHITGFSVSLLCSKSSNIIKLSRMSNSSDYFLSGMSPPKALASLLIYCCEGCQPVVRCGIWHLACCILFS
jgi:hypothetical protein